MPNDPNQSGKGPPNRLAGPSWLERLGQNYSQQTAQERLERQRIGLAQERISTYREAINAGIPEEFRGDLEAGISHETKMMNTLLPRSALRAETRRERFTGLAISSINRQYSSSSINGQVTDFARSSAGQNTAMGYMGSSYGQLERQQSSLMNQISELGRGSASLAERLYNADGTQNARIAWRIADKDRQRQELERSLGGIAGAMSIQRSMGLDPMSQNRELFGAGQKANTLLASGALDGNNAAKKAAEDLAAALEQLKNTVGKTDEQIEELRAEAKRSAEAFENAGGGGGGGNRWASRMQVAGAAFNIAGEIGREVFLNQTNTITGNRITAAGLTNNLFDRRRAALAGDMTQLTAMTSGAFAGAQAEGQVNKRTSQVTDSLLSAGGLIAGGATLMAAGAGASSTGIGAAVGVPMMVVGGIAVAAGGVAKGINVIRGADANAEKLAEEQRQIQLADQMAHIPGAMRQRLYDYGQGIRGASLEAGGLGNAFLTNTASASFLGRLQASRIGTDQFAQMSGQGFAQQGGMFAVDQIFAARNLERGGFGSMGTNMTRMGALAAAGSNNPQAGLQSVMEAAFTKSLDSSKALSMMVDNTAAMAGGSVGAGRGMDTTNASARIISGLVNPDMQNKEFAIQRAMSASQILNDINSGTSTSFSDMMGTAAIARAGGVSRTQGIRLKSLDNSTAEQLRLEMSRIEKLDPASKMEAQKKFSGDLRDNLGLGGFVDPKTGLADFNRLRAGLDQRSMGAFRTGTSMALLAGTPGFEDLAAGRIGFKELTADPKYGTLRSKIGEAAGFQGLTTQEFLSRGGMGSISAAGAGSAASAMAGANVSETKKTLDDLATVQFAEMSKEARLAAEQLGGVTQALKAMNEASGALASKVSDGNSSGIMGASAAAAKSFEMGADTFATGVQNFGTILNSFARNVGVRVPDGMQKRSAGN